MTETDNSVVINNTLVDDTAIAARYPHRLAVPQPDPFGLAILLRHPLADAQVLQPATDLDTLRLRATLLWNGQPVHLSAQHPMPPISSAFAPGPRQGAGG